jgi:Ni/Co efflux regulator RcnB
MKTLLIAAVAAFALAGPGIASAQTSVGSDVDLNARNTTHAGTKAQAKKHKHHRTTTGAGRSYGIETNDNNASAKGSLLPGKDRDFSEKFIGAK